MPSRQEGYLLIVAAILIVIFGSVAIILSRLFSTDSIGTYLNVRSIQAQYIAESGLNKAIYGLTTNMPFDKINCVDISGHADFTNISFGPGHFTVTATEPHSGQCLLVAKGSVFNENSAEASRELTQTVLIIPSHGFAVGDKHSSMNTILSWDSTQWIDASVSGLEIKNLYGVFVNGFNNVGWAVGNDINVHSSYILKWDGNGWSIYNIEHFDDQDLRVLFCVSSTYCMAAGEKRIVFVLQGSEWTQLMSPPIRSSASLLSVSCPGVDNCYVVGKREDNDLLVLHWNGSSWVREWITGETSAQDLLSVSCSSADHCWAVGSQRKFVRKTASGWQQYNDVSSLPSKNYNAVFCVSDDDCWAGGVRDGGNVLLVHWDGNTWSQVTPSTSQHENVNAIHCQSSNLCFAGGDKDMLLEYDGSNWHDANTVGIGNWNINAVYTVKQSYSISKWAEVIN
jgi:photosystem II stability/assembly factor-like uncharacterized protein